MFQLSISDVIAIFDQHRYQQLAGQEVRKKISNAAHAVYYGIHYQKSISRNQIENCYYSMCKLKEVYFFVRYRIANCFGNRYHTLVICHVAYN